MAPAVSVGAQLGIAATLTMTLMVIHIAYFPKLYREAVEDERRDIGPPWETVVTAVNFILACTTRDLQNAAALWGNNWQLIQDRVAAYARDQDLIGMVDDVHRLESTLESLDSWRSAGRTYSMIAALITFIAPLPFCVFGMKGDLLLWLPIIGATILTLLLHYIFIQVVRRHGREAKHIDKTLRGAFE